MSPTVLSNTSIDDVATGFLTKRSCESILFDPCLTASPRAASSIWPDGNLVAIGSLRLLTLGRDLVFAFARIHVPLARRMGVVENRDKLLDDIRMVAGDVVLAGQVLVKLEEFNGCSSTLPFRIR